MSLKQRYYLHGDQLDDGRYFCVWCDLLVGADHNGIAHPDAGPSDNEKRFLRDAKRFYEIKAGKSTTFFGGHMDDFDRPIRAPNKFGIWPTPRVMSRVEIGRALVVHAINEGLRTGVFGLRPWQNNWPGAPKNSTECHQPHHDDPGERGVYEWIVNGHLLRAGVRALSHAELDLTVYLDPAGRCATDRPSYVTHSWQSQKKLAKLENNVAAAASCWLERLSGTYVDHHHLYCSKRGAQAVAELGPATPKCYGATGKRHRNPGWQYLSEESYASELPGRD